MTLKKLESSISESSFVVAVTEQISSDLGGEIVILNIQSGVYHGLNEVGTRIWNLIQEPKTVKNIQNMLLTEYEIESEVCNSDILELLHVLRTSGLIEVRNEKA